MTLDDFFPGNMGRMLLIRVMLRLRRPDLAKMNKKSRLDDSLIKQIKNAIYDVNKG